MSTREERIRIAETSPPARPVVKWAGGKSQLLRTYHHCYPPGLRTGAMHRYGHRPTAEAVGLGAAAPDASYVLDGAG